MSARLSLTGCLTAINRAASLYAEAARFLCHVYKRMRDPSSHSYARDVHFGVRVESLKDTACKSWRL
jgi:hypothetical protein